jgi:hypothetical protein
MPLVSAWDCLFFIFFNGSETFNYGILPSIIHISQPAASSFRYLCLVNPQSHPPLSLTASSRLLFSIYLHKQEERRQEEEKE